MTPEWFLPWIDRALRHLVWTHDALAATAGAVDAAAPALLPWLINAEYAATALLGWFIPGLVKKGLSYWPCLSVIATTQGTKGLYYFIATLPGLPSEVVAELRSPGAEAMVQVLILGGLLWTVRLVMLQNRVEHHGNVTVDGSIEPVTVPEAERRAKQAFELIGEAQRREGGTRQASYNANVMGGWMAVSEFFHRRGDHRP